MSTRQARAIALAKDKGIHADPVLPYDYSISRIVRSILHCWKIIKASPDMPAKMRACQRSLTKYSHGDILEDFYLARTVLTMLKLRDDAQGQDMARIWLLLQTETRERRQSPFRFWRTLLRGSAFLFSITYEGRV